MYVILYDTTHTLHITHSIHLGVTLETSQSPRGWLNASAYETLCAWREKKGGERDIDV